MKSKILTVSVIASYALLSTSTFAEETTTLDPIVVSADFRDKSLSKTTTSVSIIGEDEIYGKASESFIEVLASSPNVNFTAGASKAKYIQIRGIGERSQYETPINPSVGLIIDGVDFSQLTLGATLFDINQIEVLRGPQGTNFGANAMAGIIIAESNEPTKETEGHIEATIGDYNTKTFGAAVGGTLIDNVLVGRFSVYKNTSDGYMTNTTLNRDDTNNIDELTAKAHLRWFASDNHTVDFNYMHIDVDNGFDAFSLDNTRYNQSDKPGQDTEKGNVFALKSTYQVDDSMHVISKISHWNSDSTSSYDEDWTDGYYYPPSGIDPNYDPDDYYTYDWFDEYKRDKKQTDIDVRIVSDRTGRIFNDTTDWTIGVYAKQYDEKLNRNHLKNGYDWSADQPYVDEFFNSKYKAKNQAIYGQLDNHVNEKLILTGGLRIENWEAEYSDSESVIIDNDEVLTGGKLGLSYQYDTNQLYYLSLSKGYKPGGVNGSTLLTPEEKEYETETLWNVEAGLNSSHFNDTLTSRLNIFYGKREDQQVKLYREDSRSFENFFTNAAKGSYYGLESQLDYYPNDSLHLYSSIGLLKAEFDEYTEALEGRAPAQSPEYQYNIGLDYSFNQNWMFRTNLEGRGSYYFSNTHDSKSKSYSLLNSSLSYAMNNWSVNVWAKNITDEDYAVRGFYFDNRPPEWNDEVFIQLGAPRTVGITVAYDF